MVSMLEMSRSRLVFQPTSENSDLEYPVAGGRSKGDVRGKRVRHTRRGNGDMNLFLVPTVP